MDDLAAEHRQILYQAAELRGLAEIVRTADDALEAIARVRRLDALLTAHLQREDGEVYPALQESADPVVRRLARDAAEDMGGLIHAWRAFVETATPAGVLKDPAKFARTCAAVTGALAERVLFEDETLYPLAWGLAPPSDGARAA